MKGMLGVFLLILGLMVSWNRVIAEDSFFVVPVKGQFTNWDKKIPDASRFKLVLDGEAVLDRETGLVWERSPGTEVMSWYTASYLCYQKRLGQRMGWRLPTVEELTSLLDLSNSSPALNPSHPFINVQSGFYWSLTTSASVSSNAWIVSVYYGSIDVHDKNNSRYQWCVRGGYGHDAY